jgi:aldehyde dehydrogenase (NAD+)
MGLKDGLGISLGALRRSAQDCRLEHWTRRRDRLKSLRRALVKRRHALQEALAQDLGRAATETDIVEYLPLIGELDLAIANVGRWARPRRVGTPISLFGARSEVIPQPKGVCLIISPWNYPVLLALGPLISCIAAGNTAVLKPSEFAPASTAFLQEVVAEVFSPAQVLVADGGPELSEALLKEKFDHIFFTGSPKIGRIVMTAAANGPTSVTLELGGKSPAYVHKSANLDDTVAKLVWGKFVNAGQTCIAPDYILADAEIADRLKAALAARIRAIYPLETGARRRGVDLTAIISQRHAERLLDLITDARDKGAQVLVGGEGDAAARFVAPTLIDGVTGEMRLLREEIFGPILPVVTVADADEAIRHINADAPPLASYVFSDDSSISDRYIAAAPAGGSCVNTALVHFGNERLSFGGIGPSGIGRSHGEAGFEAFSNLRAVMRDRFSMTRMIFPPYTRRVQRQLSALLRLKGAA